VSSRSAALLLLALAALAPLAAAHADPLEQAYEPLLLDFHGWLTADGAIAPAAPADGAVFVPAYAPGAAPSRLDFSMKAPSRFAPANGLDVRIHLVADKPVVAQDANGNAFTLTLLANGAPVPSASRTLSLGQAVLAPGGVADLAAVLQAPGATFDEGATLTLRLEPKMPALADQALKVAVGSASNSHADFPGARLPSVDDLGLVEPPGATLFPLSKGAFQPPEKDAAVVTFSVGQNATSLLSPLASAPVTYVVLRGDHTVAEGRAYHEFPTAAERNAAAHVWRIGAQRVRVHPGVVIALRLNVTASSVVDVACESVCPLAGYKASLPALSVVAAGGGVASDPADVLIPPPRATAGIPVSGDAAPHEHATPGVGPVLVVVAVLAVGVASGRLRFVRRGR
jgi:hypothetical protein